MSNPNSNPSSDKWIDDVVESIGERVTMEKRHECTLCEKRIKKNELAIKFDDRDTPPIPIYFHMDCWETTTNVAASIVAALIQIETNKGRLQGNETVWIN